MASNQAQATRPQEPRGPTDLPKESWLATLKRTGREFGDDNLSHWAAALTYYAILSIFPALLVLVSILGLIGQSAIQPLIDNLSTVAPGSTREIATDALENLQSNPGASGLGLVLGLAGALWASSGYIGAFMPAANVIWDAEEGRPIWKKLPLRVGITLLMLVLLTVAVVIVVATGPVAEWIGDLIGLGDTFLTVWSIAKWPVLLVIVSFMIAVLYWAAPNVRQPGFRWFSPGALLAVALWVVASLGFALYVANFGSYNATYGSLGGVIVFLIWLWITNLAILLGAEFDAELQRSRQIQRGVPPDQEPYLPLRDEPSG